MQNKKINRIIMGIIILMLVLFGVGYFITKYTKDDNSLSIVEKKWITNNINTIVDVDIYNDIPIYGYNGSGICFDFLDSFTKKYNINFNKRYYYLNDKVENSDISFKILNSNDKLKDNDILFYQDDYVVLSLKDDSINGLDDIKKVGILAQDKDLVSDYLGDDVEYREYDAISDLTKGINNYDVNYVIVPNVMYMKEILSNNLNIIYHISDLNKKYVFSIKDNTVYSIMKKYYYNYLNTNYSDDYSKEYLNIYFNSTKTDDILRKNYNAKIYKYGYVVNMPYENMTSFDFVGTISNYLSDFERIANVEIEVVRYDSIDDLKNALVSGEVDFSLTNFDYSSINMKNITTLSFSNEDYVVLSNDNITLTGIKGLKNFKVSVVGSSNIHHLCLENNIKTNVFSDTDDLIRNVNKDDVVIMDKATYFYYKDQKLKNYKIVYDGTIKNGYSFIINSDNETFAKLFNYYISSNNYMKIRYNYNTDVMLEESNQNLKVAILIVGLIVGLIFFALFINRNKSNDLGISKEDKMKYIDQMTSLKNRAYLNYNIYNWDDNVIFPQSVIVIDMNRLSEINDKFGREAGDEIIKRVAGILINSQLENTDIIRSDGDEFLIYMVGYDEKKVSSYAKKILKEIKDIPKSYGAEMGYSMIFDEVKTVDDAINESIIMMQKNKEKNK